MEGDGTMSITILLLCSDKEARDQTGFKKLNWF